MMTKRNGNRELGSSIVEFCFTIPVLLVVAGSTVDIARYMRYQQITNFVSQEAGSEIYQQCSDLTVYQKPTLNTAGSLTPDVDRTVAAVVMCATRIQNQSQMVLNKSLGRSAVASSVFRYDIEGSDPTPDCSNASQPVRRLAIKGNMLQDGSTPTIDLSQFGVSRYSPDSTSLANSIKNPINIRTSTSSSVTLKPGDDSLDDGNTSGNVNTAKLIESKIEDRDGAITVSLPSGQKRELVNKQSMCNRGRVVAVEVGYDFEPIVKFLPGMIAKLDSDGNQREITIF